MERYEELEAILKDVKEPKKSFILSLLKDFVWLEQQIEALRQYPRYIIHPENPMVQKKLEVHNMLKDYQAQKDDIATKILRSIESEASEESPLKKVMDEFL